MLAALDQAIRKIYDYKTVYPFSIKCKDVRRAEEYDTDTYEAYSVEVQQINDDGSSAIFTDLLQLPKIVRGSVKVKGRPKQGIYTALGNYKIRIGNEFFAWGSGFSGTQVCDFNWGRSNHIILKDKFDGVCNPIICKIAFSNLIKYFGLWDDSLGVYFNKDVLKEADSHYTEESATSIPLYIEKCEIPYDSLLKLRLLTKNPDLTEKVGIEEVKAFIYLMERSMDFADMPTPLDYRFLDTYEALAEELGRGFASTRNWFVNGTPGNKIRKETSHNMNKNGKFYITPLQREINNFFSNKEGAMFSNIQETTDTNALSVAEQNSKIYFEKWESSNKGATYVKQRLNPTYFVGIIDPVFTADSKDINIKNELGRDAKIRDGQVYVRLLDKKFKEVEVPAYEYLMSATLSVDNIDYINKRIFPINGEYSVYQYGEYTTITDPSKIDFLRKEDGILTDSIAMIPFANKTQSINKIVALSA